MDKSTRQFLVIFVMMFTTVIVLSGCTRLATRDTADRRWEVDVHATPEGECTVQVRVEHGDAVEDNSMTINRSGS